MLKTRGLRHLALNVRDVERAAGFYRRVFGMTEVWRPDAENAYLTSGCDNLALHRGAPDAAKSAQTLDHLGFIVEDLDELHRGYEWAQQEGLEILHPLKKHRDGSWSFYIKDLDGNVIQLLYEPHISPQTLNPPTNRQGR